MKRFLALLLCTALWVQPVLAAEEGRLISQEETGQEGETQEEAQEEEAQGGETQEGEVQSEETQSGETEGGSPEEGTSETGIEVSAPSAILMEASTGQVIYEKDADSVRPPASVTKVMTLLLIFDALADGKIKLSDEVVTSEYAASMGGSQVFLEPGEVQTADTMIKCISVASANDACVAFNFSRR